MDDLTREELMQLLTFYKQSKSDLELSLLQTQIKLNKAISLVNSDVPVPATKKVIDKKE
jgi:hypothetical protein